MTGQTTRLEADGIRVLYRGMNDESFPDPLTADEARALAHRALSFVGTFSDDVGPTLDFESVSQKTTFVGDLRRLADELDARDDGAEESSQMSEVVVHDGWVVVLADWGPDPDFEPMTSAEAYALADRVDDSYHNTVDMGSFDWYFDDEHERAFMAQRLRDCAYVAGLSEAGGQWRQMVADLDRLEGADVIERPAHYTYAGDAYETIKVIEAWGLGYHLGNAVKYISRAGRKDPAKYVEDLQKAVWYLRREIDRSGQ